MLRNILLALFAFVIIGFIVVWFVEGGPRKIFNAAQSISLSGTSTEFALPWQPANLFPAVDDKDLFGESADTVNSDAELTGMQSEYENLAQQANQAATFGDPSPFYGAVHILPFDSYPQGDSDEYIGIEASLQNTAPVSLSGWSLQSAVSGVRVGVPPAATRFVMGAVNSPRPVSLDPGASATISTAASPVGVSFRENSCTGYLAQLQSFSPVLSRECPSPANELPLSPDNLQKYGESCFNFIQALPACEFRQSLPSDLSPNCRTFVQTHFSYNGCLDAHSGDIGFSKSSWRLYLGQSGELWKNNHDAIRLFDAEGRIVDVYVY